MTNPTMWMFFSHYDDKNDLTCLLATQFVMNGGADQAHIRT